MKPESSTIKAGAVVFTLLAVLFFLMQAWGERYSDIVVVLINLCVGSGIKAASLWLSYLSGCEDLSQVSAVCLGISGFLMIIVMIIVFAGGFGAAFFCLVFFGISVAVVFVIDLIVFIGVKIAEKFNN